MIEDHDNFASLRFSTSQYRAQNKKKNLCDQEIKTHDKGFLYSWFLKSDTDRHDNYDMITIQA